LTEYGGGVKGGKGVLAPIGLASEPEKRMGENGKRDERMK